MKTNSVVVTSQYAIYKRPLDFPDDYVISKWDVVEGNPEPVKDDSYQFINKDLEPCREELRKKGLYNMGRMLEDDPVIFEVWI